MSTINSVDMQALFSSIKTIAVVGLSSNPHRPSYGVSSYLQRMGYRIIPVNPVETEILGEKCYQSLLNIPDKIDVVDVFRNPEAVGPIAEDAIRIGARYLWLQEGVINSEAAKKALQAGLEVIIDHCMLKEHRAIS